MNKQMKIIFGGLIILLIALLGIIMYSVLTTKGQNQYKKPRLSTAQLRQIKSSAQERKKNLSRSDKHRRCIEPSIQEKKKDSSWSGKHKKTCEQNGGKLIYDRISDGNCEVVCVFDNGKKCGESGWNECIKAKGNWEMGKVPSSGINTQDVVDPLSYKVNNSRITVFRNIEKFNYTIDKLVNMSRECGSNKTENYFGKLVDQFKNTPKFIYNFQLDNQGIFTVTILVNKMNYTNMEDFKKDFDICHAGGDAYPAMLNKDWLLFISSCGTGMESDSAKSCDEIKKLIMPSLKLK